MSDEKPILKIGFTGTHRGASAFQLDELVKTLTQLRDTHAEQFTVELHHGQCIGADEQAAKAAKGLGYRVVAHPGLAKDPKNLLYRAEFEGNDEVRDAKPFIERDHDIVDESTIMIATPVSREDHVRSGTWTTVRYAKKVGRKEGVTLFIIKPPFTPPQWTRPEYTKTNAIAGDDPKALVKRGIIE